MMKTPRTSMATPTGSTVLIHHMVLLLSSARINVSSLTDLRSTIYANRLPGVAAIYALWDFQSLGKFFNGFMLPNKLTFVPQIGQERSNGHALL